MLFCWTLVIAILPIVNGHAPMTFKCPEGWMLHQHGQTCVRVSDRKDRLSWGDARYECRCQGGDLVKINDPAMRDFIKDAISSKREYYWIGLHDNDADGKFQWLDEKQQSSFEWWDCREPSNHGGKERCVEIIPRKAGRWNDKRCSVKRPFICQKKATKESIKVIIKCTFEGGQNCEIKPGVSNTTNTRWQTQKAGDATIGPTLDHDNSKNGHYYLLTPVAGTPKQNRLGKIDFHDVHISKRSCLSYYYQTSDALRGIVLVKVEKAGQQSIKHMPDIMDVPEKTWVKEFIDFQQDEYDTISLFIVLTTVSMAVDDIKLVEASCQYVREHGNSG